MPEPVHLFDGFLLVLEVFSGSPLRVPTERFHQVGEHIANCRPEQRQNHYYDYGYQY